MANTGSDPEIIGNGGPGVVLCHAWWGVSEGIRRQAARLAGAGFLVAMPDLYAGRIAATEAEAKHLRTAFPLETRQLRFDSAVDALLADSRRDAGAIAAVGFSMGAAWALGLAGDRPNDVSAVVVYYGTGDLAELPASGVSVLGHFAEHDSWEPDEEIAAFDERLGGLGIPFERHTYAGAAHWFAESDVPTGFDPAADDLAFRRTIAFLHSRLDARDAS